MEDRMAKTGTTTGNLKMRSGPGMQFDPPIAFLEPNTTLEILGEEGDWLKVRAAGKEGYVGRKYVSVAAESAAEAAKPAAPAGGIAKREAPPATQAGAPSKARSKAKPFQDLNEE
jgi:D-alanyl-D-alanine carboxypeptidase